MINEAKKLGLKKWTNDSTNLLKSR
jgi:hypothetical protein